MKHVEEYRDAEIAKKLAEKIRQTCDRPVRLMEVCGTHTMSIFRSGIRSVLPEEITLLSGPGCPVCVTAQGEIDAFVSLAGMEDVIVTTFGDLMRVPGSRSSLQKQRAAGNDIRMVYSSLDAVKIAKDNPDKKVVFLGVGFETTAPTIAASVLAAAKSGIDNYFVYSAHKLVPPALAALMQAESVNVDGFILPGHVSVIIGLEAYRPFFEAHRVPCVVAGFEPADILSAVYGLCRQIRDGAPALENSYMRAVSRQGNPKAREIMETVFETADAAWRGIGVIEKSGLTFRDTYAAYDARQAFELPDKESPEPPGCACGEILTGAKTPPQCPLYKKRCTPTDPVGPCMVSSEGTCAAYFRYHDGG